MQDRVEFSANNWIISNDEDMTCMTLSPARILKYEMKAKTVIYCLSECKASSAAVDALLPVRKLHIISSDKRYMIKKSMKNEKYKYTKIWKYE